MPVKLKTSIDEALAQFKLIDGAGSEEDKQACAMTLLAWVCGEEWSDHPPCAHRLIADNVIRANDDSGTTSEMRAELVRAGESGALDTWWVPSEAITAALVLHEGDDPDVFARTMRMLERITEWKDTKSRAVLSGAVGNAFTVLPTGWKVAESGLIVKAEAEAAWTPRPSTWSRWRRRTTSGLPGRR
jgi:hypothetical protein